MCTHSYVNEPLMFIDDHTIFYFILLFIKNVYCSNKPPMTLIARIIVFCFFIEREKQKLYAFRLSLTNRNSIWSYLNKQIQKWELGDYFVLFIGVCDFDLKQLNSVNKCFFFFSKAVNDCHWLLEIWKMYLWYFIFAKQKSFFEFYYLLIKSFSKYFI